MKSGQSSNYTEHKSPHENRCGVVVATAACFGASVGYHGVFRGLPNSSRQCAGIFTMKWAATVSFHNDHTHSKLRHQCRWYSIHTQEGQKAVSSALPQEYVMFKIWTPITDLLQPAAEVNSGKRLVPCSNLGEDRISLTGRFVVPSCYPVKLDTEDNGGRSVKQISFPFNERSPALSLRQIRDFRL